MSKPQPTCGPDHGVTTACQHLLATNPAAVPSVIHTNTCGFNHTGQPVCVDYHKVAPKCPAGMICPAELLASYGMIFDSQGYGIITLDYLHPPYVVADGSSMLRQIITRYRQFRPASVDTICVSDHGHAFTGGPDKPLPKGTKVVYCLS